MAQLADTDLTVLLQGESGTGKEVVARLLGLHSGRMGEFVKINCAAIPDELLESELFGYEQGAFTGATRQRSGKFELAGNGSIFLDEIGEMPLQLQVKLLHVLQDGEFSRLGGRRPLIVDVRVVAASNTDLQAAVAAGTFRRDLYYRLNVVTLFLPPLRQRVEDIPLLTNYFLDKYSRLYSRCVAPLSPSLEERLCQHSWPGNVRELENLIKRYLVLGETDVLLAGLLQPPTHSASPLLEDASAPAQPRQPASLLQIGRQAARQAERAALLQVLADTRWNRRLAAVQLKISYKGLQNKIRALLSEAAA
ncbi:MAG: sigma-54 interaction domain-containing protein [Terriglobales bacterium]